MNSFRLNDWSGWLSGGTWHPKLFFCCKSPFTCPIVLHVMSFSMPIMESGQKCWESGCYRIFFYSICFMYIVHTSYIPAIFLSRILRQRASAFRIGQFSIFVEKLRKKRYSFNVTDIRRAIVNIATLIHLFINCLLWT